MPSASQDDPQPGPGAGPTVVVVERSDEPDPPGLDRVTALGATVHVVRTGAELDAVLDAADVLVVYDIRSRLLHDVGARLAHVGWVHAASAGLDAVLTPTVLDGVREGRTIVTNARGVFDRPIAEFVLAMLLFFTKDVRATIEQQRAHRWVHRDTERLGGRRALVVGAGSIGREVARLLRAVGMDVAGVARRPRPDDPDFTRVVDPDGLHDELALADDVVVCAPLTAATRGMFDESAFAAFRTGARFVNVGRGALVDEAALLAALHEGRVGAAALDVFVDEPLPPDSPFWDLEQVVVSPHRSGDVAGWRDALAAQLADNLARRQRGEALDSVVEGADALAPEVAR
jgi:phosphoglycerate dehydrogenase-like enzyme